MTRAIVFDGESPDIIELRKEFKEKFGSTKVFDYFYTNLRNRIAKDTNKAMIEGQKMIPLCLNCLSVLNVYGGCDKCNRLLLKEIEENYGES